MTRAQKHIARIASLAASLLPAIAMAHPGHPGEVSSFASGALHPLGLEHLVALVTVGLLAGRLGGRYLWPLAAAFLGLLVAAWTTDSDGWHYAAGFMLTSAGLIAAGVIAARLIAMRLRAARRGCAAPSLHSR